MDRAAKVLGKELKYNKIEDPSEAKYEFGTVDIIETGDYDTDSIEWGKVQALAGQMAVDWIMKSIELGEAGKIDAVSTAPIHKGAIKLIGVKEPGHTEIYQNVTHSPIRSDNVLLPQIKSILRKQTYVTCRCMSLCYQRRHP